MIKGAVYLKTKSTKVKKQYAFNILHHILSIVKTQAITWIIFFFG